MKKKPELTLEAKADALVKKVETLMVDNRETGARTLLIVDQRTYNIATEAFAGARDLRDAIVDHHRDMKVKSYAAWQSVIAAEKKVLTPVENSFKALSSAIGNWDAEQQRKREAEEERIREDARQRAEDDRQRQAAAAFRQGADEQEVEEILATPLPAVRVSVGATYEKSANVGGTRKRYRAVPIQEKPIGGDAVKAKIALIKLAAKNPAAYAQYLELDQSALNALAQRQNIAFSIPGCFTYEEENRASAASKARS